MLELDPAGALYQYVPEIALVNTTTAIVDWHYISPDMIIAWMTNTLTDWAVHIEGNRVTFVPLSVQLQQCLYLDEQYNIHNAWMTDDQLDQWALNMLHVRWPEFNESELQQIGWK